MIFQRERLNDFLEEAKPLFVKHYDEIAWRKDKIVLKPDWAKYEVLDERDELICFTGRVGGKLVAYALFFFFWHPHYNSTHIAQNDILFVHPAYRGGVGADLIEKAEDELRALGADVITYHIKKILDWGDLAERMGYEEVETSYWKWTGG